MSTAKPKILGAVRLNDVVYRDGQEDEFAEALDKLEAKEREKAVAHLSRHGTIEGFESSSARSGQIPQATLDDPTLAAAEGLARSSKTFTEPSAGRVVDSPAPDAFDPNARRDRRMPEDEPERQTNSGVSARDLQEGRGSSAQRTASKPPGAADEAEEDEEGYGAMRKAELKAEAEKRNLTVTRRDGEDGEPLVEDYVRALEEDDASKGAGSKGTSGEGSGE